jgi:hypothetical protein
MANEVMHWDSVYREPGVFEGPRRGISVSPTGTGRARPFVWTKTADDILKKAQRQETSNTVH